MNEYRLFLSKKKYIDPWRCKLVAILFVEKKLATSFCFLIKKNNVLKYSKDLLILNPKKKYCVEICYIRG